MIQTFEGIPCEVGDIRFTFHRTGNALDDWEVRAEEIASSVLITNEMLQLVTANTIEHGDHNGYARRDGELIYLDCANGSWIYRLVDYVADIDCWLMRWPD